jgi:hypothetical protein
METVLVKQLPTTVQFDAARFKSTAPEFASKLFAENITLFACIKTRYKLPSKRLFVIRVRLAPLWMLTCHVVAEAEAKK